MNNDFFKLFKEFFELRLTDLVLEYTDEKINLMNTHSSNLSKRGLFIRLLSFIKKAIFNSSFYFPSSKEEKILVACNSLNEYEASSFLKESEEIDTVFIGSYPNKHNFISYLVGFLLLPVLLIKILKEKNKTLNLSLPYTLDQLMISSGIYFTYRSLFHKKVKALVISNHLSPETIVSMQLAKRNGIEIVYLQHSQLVSKYPPIESDYFLLSGKDSLRKLKNINKNIDESKICLTGCPKLDKLEIKNKNSFKNISICINPGANFEKVKELILLLKKNFNASLISIRPHPSIRKKYLKSYKNLNIENLFLISPKEESLEKFLERSDIVISDDSGIYYEAGYVGNISLSFRMSERSSDWYDLKGAENHKILNSPNELIEEIKMTVDNKLNKRSGFKIFFENIGTDKEGKSSDLAIDFLSEENLI